MTPPIPPDVHLSVVAPIAVVGLGAMGVLMMEVLMSRRVSLAGRTLTGSFIGASIGFASIFVLLVSMWVAWAAFSGGGVDVFNPARAMYQLDAFSSLVTALIALGSLLSCALAIGYLDELHIHHGEYYALLLLSTAGMFLLVGAVDLMSVFLGVEFMSIPIYVLAGFDRRKLRGNESAFKYFLIGSFASAVLLYGMALLYGATGATSYAGIQAALAAATSSGAAPGPLALVGLGLVVVGFAFKVSSVPFHQWTPDVYEGAPSSVTAFMSVTVKTAAFAALMRFLLLALPPDFVSLDAALWLMAAATIVVGNVMAVIQDNVKRLLAYSSIAHAGYVLVGFVVGGPDGYSAVLFYLLVYVFMNLGAFGVVVALADRGRDFERMESFAGLARSRPVLAAVMTIFMISLAGIPGTAGFIAKLQVFMAAARAGEIPLMILAVLASVVSVYYYLRIPVLMYMREPGEEAPRMAISTPEILVLGLCTAAVLFLGLFPNLQGLPALDWARQSVGFFFTS